jgi:hypothetical protein
LVVSLLRCIQPAAAVNHLSLERLVLTSLTYLIAAFVLKCPQRITYSPEHYTPVSSARGRLRAASLMNTVSAPHWVRWRRQARRRRRARRRRPSGRDLAPASNSTASRCAPRAELALIARRWCRVWWGQTLAAKPGHPCDDESVPTLLPPAPPQLLNKTCVYLVSLALLEGFNHTRKRSSNIGIPYVMNAS